MGSGCHAPPIGKCDVTLNDCDPALSVFPADGTGTQIDARYVLYVIRIVVTSSFSEGNTTLGEVA